MACEGVGDVRWRSTETAMVRQGGIKTTGRIELKWRMAKGGCQTAVSAVVDITAVVLCHLLNWGDVAILGDSYWSRGLVLRVLLERET
jgi:hypothetical protein